MVDVLRFHEISEATHWVMNPIFGERVAFLGEICRIRPGSTVLDLACGKGALLGLLAQRFGANGVGVDIHPPFLADARRRAEQLRVATQLTFLEADAGDPACVEGRFEVVGCLGATWIGGGLTGTLELMRRWLAPGGWLLVGECFWMVDPSESAKQRHKGGEDFTDLAGTLRRFEPLATTRGVAISPKTADASDGVSSSSANSTSDLLPAKGPYRRRASRCEVRGLRV